MERFLAYSVKDGFLTKDGKSMTKDINDAMKFKHFEEADLIVEDVKELFGNDYSIQSYKVKDLLK